MTLTLVGVTRSAQCIASWLNFLAHFSADQDEIGNGAEAIKVEHTDTSFE